MDPENTAQEETIPGRVGRGSDQTARSAHVDISTLRRLYRVQVMFYLQEQRAIRVATGYRQRTPLTDVQIDKLRTGLSLITDDELAKRMDKISDALSRIGRGFLDAIKALETVTGNADDEELIATMRAEFLRSAHTFTDEEWAVLDEVRRVKAERGAKAAMLAGRTGLRRLAREAEEQA